MKKVLIALILILFPGVSLAGPVDVTARTDKKEVTIGDRVRYEVRIEYDDGVEIEPLDIGGNLGEFEVKDYNIKEPERAGDNKNLTGLEYVITAFTTGEFVIRPATVKYRDRQGDEKEAASNEVRIEVKSVGKAPGDNDDIRGLKAPVEIKGGFSLWPVIVLIVLLVAGAATFFYFRKGNRVKEELAVPSRSPEEIASERLNELLGMALAEKGMSKEYYIRLSDIVRNYIEGKYGILATDRTTWELHREMKARRVARAYADKVRDFLDDCDLVKFAKYIPERKEAEEAYKRAEEIVGIS